MSNPPQQVSVRLCDRGYNIEIGQQILGRSGKFLLACQEVTHAVVITDEHVAFPHAQQVADSLQACQVRTDTLTVPAGEQSKSVATTVQLWEELLSLGTDRKSVIIAVGGGVIGDLAGFVAATFSRGIRLVQVPTTLLAQVDSSVGGKVGINLPRAKNMVGSFWQPLGVLIDTGVLRTLPEREYRAGLAEVVKYGVILDADFFAYLETHTNRITAAEAHQRDSAVLQQVIARCCQLKANVVEDDERETTGKRSVLNYGHTFAHALEAVMDYKTLLHGEAVSIGMLCASRLAERLGRVDATFTRRQKQLLTTLGLPTEVPKVSSVELVERMRHDKKTEHGKLRFVLPTSLGHVELVDHISEDDVVAALTG